MCLTDHLLKPYSCFHQMVFLVFEEILVLFKVNLTVGVHAHQAGFDGFAFSSSTDAALHISRTSRISSRLECRLPQFLHHFSQNGVFAQYRSWSEGLSALGTAVDPLRIILIPAVCNTDHTVSVSTGQSHRLLQEIQAYWTAELVRGH